MNLSNQSILKMHELRNRTENEDEILIGRPDCSNFIILPNIGVEIIELLDKGHTISEVEKIMEERFGETVDVLSFAQDLIIDYQFVYTVDGIVVNEKVYKKDHFPWISEQIGKFLFNKIAFWVYFITFISGMLICIIQRKYFPTYTDIFISSSITLSTIVAISCTWGFLFLHEFAHLMAARSLGIGSRIGLSHRLIFMVAETNMSNIVLISPDRRYKAYFAGMAWDAFFLGMGIWIKFFQEMHFIQLPESLLMLVNMLTLTLFMGLAFQFMFFMRTDIYYAFTTKFKCNNLLENTNLYLKKFYSRFTDVEKAEWENINEREKNIVKWYVWFYLLGVIWSVLFFITYTLQFTLEFISRIIDGISNHPVLSGAFIDGVLLIIIVLIPFAIVCYSWIKTWKLSRTKRIEIAIKEQDIT